MEGWEGNLLLTVSPFVPCSIENNMLKKIPCVRKRKK